jgi:hypothetical protein
MLRSETGLQPAPPSATQIYNYKTDRTMPDTPSSRPWELEWYYFSDCACAWKGDDFKALWKSIVDHHLYRVDELFGVDGDINSSSSLIYLIREVVLKNCTQFSWNEGRGWPPEIKVGVRVWPSADGAPERDGVHAVLTTDSFYLILSESLNIEDDETKTIRIDRRHSSDKAYVSINDSEHVEVDKLEPRIGQQIWLDPFMNAIDNEIVVGKNEEIKKGVAKIPNRSRDRRARMANLISRIAKSVRSSNRDKIKETFFTMHKHMRYDFLGGKAGIEKSTFSNEDGKILLKLGLELPPELDAQSPDYPCGNLQERI